jgi:hypothetical protein
MNEVGFVLRAGRKIVFSTTKTFNHKRYSQRCAAEQRFLDGLIKDHPTAVTAEIVKQRTVGLNSVLKFNIVNGKSSYVRD